MAWLGLVGDDAREDQLSSSRSGSTLMLVTVDIGDHVELTSHR
jgi:hypothetical protein